MITDSIEQERSRVWHRIVRDHELPSVTDD